MYGYVRLYNILVPAHFFCSANQHFGAESEQMSRAIWDARKGIFTDKPANGATKAPTNLWRVEKGWPKYFEAREAHPIEILAEIKEFLAGRFPNGWKRQDLSEEERLYLSAKAEKIRKDQPETNLETLEEHLGRQDNKLTLIQSATYDKKFMSITSAKIKRSTEICQLPDHAFSAYRAAHLEWLKKPQGKPPKPFDFMEFLHKAPPKNPIIIITRTTMGNRGLYEETQSGR